MDTDSLMKKQRADDARRFSIYVSVGVLCATIDIGMMHLLLRLGIHYLAAATTGFFTGFVVNFVLHTRVTFGAYYSHRALARFSAVVVLNYILSVLIVFAFQELWLMPLLGKLVSLPLVAVNGFLLSKHWVYRQGAHTCPRYREGRQTEV